jgi:hypothetical protein
MFYKHNYDSNSLNEIDYLSVSNIFREPVLKKLDAGNFSIKDNFKNRMIYYKVTYYCRNSLL